MKINKRFLGYFLKFSYKIVGKIEKQKIKLSCKIKEIKKINHYFCSLREVELSPNHCIKWPLLHSWGLI